MNIARTLHRRRPQRRKDLDIQHGADREGPTALQGGGGIVKFRKVEIREC